MKSKFNLKKVSFIVSIILLFGLFASFKYINRVLATERYNQYTEVKNSDIKVELKSNKDNLVPMNTQTAKIEYEINPQQINTQIDDVIFLIDLSSNVKEQKDQTQDKMGSRINFIEQLLQLVKGDNNISSECNIGVIGYSDQIYEQKKSDGTFFVHKNDLQDIANNLKAKINDANYNTEGRNIKPALVKAKEYFNNVKENKKRNQEIIMISSGVANDIDYNNITNDSTITSIKNEGYNIVTIDITNDLNNKTSSSDDDINSEDSNKLITLHNRLNNNLCKKDYDYIVAQPNGDNYANDLSGVRSSYESLIEKLIEGTALNNAVCEYNNEKMNFAINDKYDIGNEAIIDFGSSENVPDELKQSAGSSGIVKVPINIEDGVAIIPLDNCIKYKKENGNSSVFSAKPFKISFDVTVNGVDQNPIEFGIGNNQERISNLIYDKNINGSISKELIQLQNTRFIMRNFDSYLNVKLTNPDPNPTKANIGDTLDVKYDINAVAEGEAVETGILVPKESIDEVIFLADISEKMKSCARDTYIENGMQNEVIGGSNIDDNKNLKMGLIAMGDEPILVRSEIDKERAYSNNNLLDRKIGEEKDTFRTRICTIENMIKNKGENGEDKSAIKKPNVNESLKKADEIFQREGEHNSSKAIVIVTANDFTCDEEVIKDIKNHGYKIIIVDVTNDIQQTQNLQSRYKELGGYGEKYISGTFMDNSNYNNANGDFEKVANSINEGSSNKPYKLSNIKLNFDLGTAFSPVSGLEKEENLEGNRYSITIPDITFNCEILENPSKEDSTKMKVKYSLDPESKSKMIEFKVKFEQYNSDYSAIFGTPETTRINNNISYDDIGGYQIKNSIETPIISDNDIPIINTCLESSTPMYQGENPKIINCDPGNEINLSYKISPQEFEYNKYNCVSQDVVVLFDTTTDEKGKGQEWNKAKQEFNNYIIDEFMNNNNVKLDVVSFDSSGKIENITNGLTTNSLEVKEKINRLKSTGDGYGKIDDALNEASSILDKSDSTKKSIVIVTFGDIRYESSNNTINDISENQKYNIFTTYVSKIKNNDSDVETYIKELHSKLSGNDAAQDENYINNSKSQGNGNNGNAFEKIMNLLKEKLEGKLINIYSVNDAVLTFNLNNNFELVSGAIKDEIDTNLIKIQIPEIVYRLTNVNGKRKYVADPIENSNFTIKPKLNKLGELRFANSTIEYKKMHSNSNSVSSVETPIINIGQPITVEHGVYKGLKNGAVEFEKDRNQFIVGSVVPIAATVCGMQGNRDIKISIADGTEFASVPKAYYISNNELQDINITFLQNEKDKKVYECSAIDGDLYRNIVILYSIRLTDKKSQYISTCSEVNSNKSGICTIYPSENTMPGLF